MDNYILKDVARVLCCFRGSFDVFYSHTRKMLEMTITNQYLLFVLKFFSPIEYNVFSAKWICILKPASSSCQHIKYKYHFFSVIS